MIRCVRSQGVDSQRLFGRVPGLFVLLVAKREMG